LLDEGKAKQEIQGLVDKYNRIVASGEIKEYTEEDTKQDFIMKLFAILGWDVENKFQKEVTAERKVSRGKVDYAFRIQEIPKFLLEAKSFEAGVTDRKFIDQAINYAWLKGVTWAVLTNFKTIKVFNSEIKAETLNVMQFLELDCDDFISKFDKLLLLSKDSLETGKLDEAAEEVFKKLPKKPIDDRLFSDLTLARDILAKNIIKNNSTLALTPKQIEEAIQRIISRLVFIRTLEDKEFEPPTLLPVIRENREKPIVSKIKKVYRRLDEIYDAKLFESHLCEDLEIDNYQYETVIEGLYQSEEQIQKYDFHEIDSDILGGIYEEYLSFILEAIKSGSKLDETNKKKRGIYYTPKPIVNLIVKNVFAELEKKQVDLQKIRILDPACGSGSFLIKCYDFILQKFLPKEDGNEFINSESIENISYEKKVGLLENNIFGVDVDVMAVEIAQLNLFLKAVSKKKHLPILRNNILHGNSLIADKSVKVGRGFDWKEELPTIMNEGGFDVVIGNPPYVRPHNLEKDYKELLWKNFTTFKAKSDLYNCFMEKGINLLKNGGIFSFIVPHTWTSLESFYEIRKFILETCKIIKLIQLPKKVFKKATVEACIFIFAKENDLQAREENEVIVEKFDESGKVTIVKKFQQSKIKTNHLYNFELYSEEAGNEILNKVKKQGTELENLVKFSYGLKTGDDEKFIVNFEKNSDCKKLLRSKNISRYSKKFDGDYVWYVPELMIKNKKTARPGDKERFESRKLIVSRMGKEVTVTYDKEKFYVKDAMLLLKKHKNTNLKYLAGILNSKLINYFYKNYFITVDVLKNALLDLRIAKASETDMEKISSRVEIMEELHQKINSLGNLKLDERNHLEQEIKKIDYEIDEIVYRLYGISDEEKNIMEISSLN